MAVHYYADPNTIDGKRSALCQEPRWSSLTDARDGVTCKRCRRLLDHPRERREGPAATGEKDDE